MIIRILIAARSAVGAVEMVSVDIQWLVLCARCSRDDCVADGWLQPIDAALIPKAASQAVCQLAGSFRRRIVE